ncbi:adenylate cyclase [Ruegeria sp. 2205SS24-7]|uniref:tetratricopeptide repeat protein n=1 Tax=Ruegeria discodermiae TaxID=3064389 RepID=UPI0027417044|nr:adenylate cyclase [Ruegeria sp. 2205SS24-7]MDP5221013.1 adenylate cyclase [Ruegeria sp. 2205SS24-7]
MGLSKKTSTSIGGGRTPDAKDVRVALQRLVGSQTFAGSQRLQDFLIYVVEESINGRADEIRAKTIAMDVYGATMSEMARRENVVRVDAGRLRRKLAEYYVEDGRDEVTVFDLPKGGYAPEISIRSPGTDQPELPETETKTYTWPRPFIGIAGVFLIICVAVAIALMSTNRGVPVSLPVDSLSQDERSAIFDASPMRLQSVNLANSGRDLIFPALEPARLNGALTIFKGAIENDDSYFGGHAGAAQVAATIALVTPDADPTGDVLRYADTRASRAIELAPETGWSQSAKAWVEFTKGNWPEAMEFSYRAQRLAPNDVHVLEFVSLILLYSGEFEKVVATSEDALSKIDLDRGYVFQNAMGSAKFHLKDFEGAVSAFEQVTEKGGPVGPVSVAYLMAAHQMLGNESEAQALSDKLSREWPDSRVDILFQRLFANPEYGVELGDAMKQANWHPKVNE